MKNRDECGTGLAITMPTNLIGVDVGFSKTRPTTGIACLEGEHLSLFRTGTAWKSREAIIPLGFQPFVIAIDGPLLPKGSALNIRRHVESVFIRAPFHNRCRPGLGHHGVGLELREASSDACAQFSRILAASVSANSGTVRREGPIVEAFPNAFLGVLMPEVELQSVPKLKRGRRFDWLYELMVTTGRLESVLSRNLILPDVVWHRLRSETDHELRAALICLLTAALAAQGTAAIIGESTGGWFWMYRTIIGHGSIHQEERRCRVGSGQAANLLLFFSTHGLPAITKDDIFYRCPTNCKNPEADFARTLEVSCDAF